MRTTILNLIEKLSAATDLPEPIYEFGSCRVPGQERLSTVKSFFSDKVYIGCDMQEGTGVDEVQNLHQLDIPDDAIGTALVLDTIEHVGFPWRAMEELHRCLRPGGLLIMTSVFYFPIHAYPDDFWRFTASGFSSLTKDFDQISTGSCGLKKLPHTVWTVVSKGACDPCQNAAIVGAVEGWQRHGASSWKEHLLNVVPPVCLTPAYDTFNWLMRLLARGGSSNLR